MNSESDFIIECISKTNIGKKRNNEDAVYHSLVDNHSIIKAFLVIADGVGGNKFGEVASNYSIKVIIDFFSNSAKKYEHYCDKNNLNKNNIDENLKTIFFEINNEICKRGSTDGNGMATTLTCCILTSKELYYAHLGDCRLYIIRNNNIEQITLDDSTVEEKLRAGLITLEESKKMIKNQITQAIGKSNIIKVQNGKKDIFMNDIILLCSDGLHGILSDEEIKNLSLSNFYSEIPEKLIEKAIEKDAYDNISLSIAKLTEDEINTKKKEKSDSVLSKNEGKIKVIFSIISIIFFTFLLFFFGILELPDNYYLENKVIKKIKTNNK